MVFKVNSPLNTYGSLTIPGEVTKWLLGNLILRFFWLLGVNPNLVTSYNKIKESLAP